jgi:erythrocyte band 7 integral membrane protein
VSAPVARRNAESKIINAEGDVEVAKLLNNRSKILDSKTAIQVRYLETIKSLGRNESSKIIYSSFM